MKFRLALAALLLFACGSVRAADEYRQLTKVDRRPLALNGDFQFRKTKTFLLGDVPGLKKQTPSSLRGLPRDPAVGFETTYLMHGAVTELDRRRRYGNYFKFFWRAKRATALTVRLEYQQEKLRTLTQAREVSYASAKGSHQTSFAVVGDDFFNDGQVLAWRCLLIADGRIVAENRSFLWK